MRPTPSIRAPRNDLRNLTRLISWAGSIFGILVIGIMAYAGLTSDRAAIQRDRGLVANALDESIAQVLNEQKTVAWWDEALEHIAHSFDKEWVNSQIGVYLAETYGHDEIYVISDKGDIIYSLGPEGKPGLDLTDRAALLKPVIFELRGKDTSLLRHRDAFGPAQDFPALKPGETQRAKWGGHVLNVGGHLSVVTGISISPNRGLNMTEAAPYLLLSVVHLDKAFMDNIGKSLLLQNFALNDATPAATGLFVEPIVDDKGTASGTLSWTPKQPGRILLTIILPLVALGLFAAGYITALTLRGLGQASDDLTRREADAIFQSRHDALSELPNRVFFVEATQRALAAQAGAGLTGPVIALLDVDRFKDINDTLGHQAGDELIKAVAARLQRTLASADCLARFGGDEFAVLRTAADQESINNLTSLLKGAFSEPFEFRGQQLRVTTSIGVASAPEHGSTADELVRNADIALYKAKARGRDRAITFSAEMEREVQIRRAVELDLRDAIGSNQLTLFYQPIVSCQTHAIIGVEALLRWRHPIKGDIPPSSFIPIAEEAGLMPALGAWVVERAFHDSARWPEIETAINLSPDQFRHLDLAQFLKGAAEKHSVNAGRIVLEITESLLLESSPRVRQTLQSIHDLGFKVALDDFGTGHSSLTYLRVFHFDKLKIDRSFVSGLPAAENTRTIVHSVINLGRALGMEVVAEGVETEPEAAMMRLFGCTAMQGYLFSRPIDREACERLIREQRMLAPEPAMVATGSVVDLGRRRV